MYNRYVTCFIFQQSDPEPPISTGGYVIKSNEGNVVSKIGGGNYDKKRHSERRAKTLRRTYYY